MPRGRGQGRRLIDAGGRCDNQAADARCAAEIPAALNVAGTPIGPSDILVAGQALARDLTLITHDIREFSASAACASKTGKPDHAAFASFEIRTSASSVSRANFNRAATSMSRAIASL